jgi:hypothetical protein
LHPLGPPTRHLDLPSRIKEGIAPAVHLLAVIQDSSISILNNDSKISALASSMMTQDSNISILNDDIKIAGLSSSMMTAR